MWHIQRVWAAGSPSLLSFNINRTEVMKTDKHDSIRHPSKRRFYLERPRSESENSKARGLKTGCLHQNTTTTETTACRLATGHRKPSPGRHALQSSVAVLPLCPYAVSRAGPVLLGARISGMIPGFNSTVLITLPHSMMLIQVESILMGFAFLSMIIVRPG